MTQKEAEAIAICAGKCFARVLTRWAENGIIKWTKDNFDENLVDRNDDGTFGSGFSNSTPQEFHDAVASAKASCDEKVRWRVDVHDPSDYEGVNLHVTKGGSTVAVTEDGDIISVCHAAGDKTRGWQLMKMAVENGGVKLDSFAGNHDFYMAQGFSPVSWTSFNTLYAPEGWTEGKHAKEPVIFYKYTGENTKPISVQEFLSNTPECKGDSGYEDAMKIRDNSLR